MISSLVCSIWLLFSLVDAVDVDCILGGGEGDENIGVRRCRVPGGHVCAQGNWPWLVFINITTPIPHPDGNGRFLKQFCTGTVISEHYVMTAAHCVMGPTPYRFEKSNTT